MYSKLLLSYQLVVHCKSNHPSFCQSRTAMGNGTSSHLTPLRNMAKKLYKRLFPSLLSSVSAFHILRPPWLSASLSQGSIVCVRTLQKWTNCHIQKLFIGWRITVTWKLCPALRQMAVRKPPRKRGRPLGYPGNGDIVTSRMKIIWWLYINVVAQRFIVSNLDEIILFIQQKKK